MGNNIDLHATYVRRGELAWVLPRRIWEGVCRLARRERRRYLVVDGRIIATFTREADHDLFMEWVRDTHESTYRAGTDAGRRTWSDEILRVAREDGVVDLGAS